MSDNITRIFQLSKIVSNHNLDTVIAGKENGKWKKYSATEFNEIAENISYGLLKLGIDKGDRISIISTNRTEWLMTDIGIAKMGGINAPIYPNINTEEYKYILEDCGAKVVFVGNKEIYNKIKDLYKNNENIIKIYSFDDIEGVESWKNLIELGKNNQLPSKTKDNQIETKEDDLFTLIYTSGTTGKPKGVMISHKNILHQIHAIGSGFPVRKNMRALSFLPLCHVFERAVTYYYLYNGISIWYAESIEQVGENMKEVHPHMFTTVPRLLEKVYDKIVSKGGELSGIKHALFFWALNLGLKHDYDGKNGAWYEFQLKIANKIIFNKWREALGGSMDHIFVGAAALQPRLAKVFTAAQIPVYEGYGLSETSPVISVNMPGENQSYYGTVGKVLPKVEVKIDSEEGSDEGEILVKGDNVMLGYFNHPEKTAKAMSGEWFHTGDIGKLINGKFLKITDRKKEIFKTSGGKYVAPQVMENKFKESIFIEQIMVIGEGQKHPAAFIVPSFVTLREWCRRKNIGYTSDSEIITDKRIITKFKEEIDKYNEAFAHHEQIKKFKILPLVWGVDTGELTATLKLKRKPILLKYNKEFNEIYGITE
ncbi:MAG: long-chain fatty acid--CoA ligase [Ichthyobacteriaceae bacterium]|nr:long-chain fatty acid--CoA ligase [Ichthyobacteriaceae bacterium]